MKYEPIAFKQGFCDGMFNRACNTPKTLPECYQYLSGFWRGKEAGKGVLSSEFIKNYETQA